MNQNQLNQSIQKAKEQEDYKTLSILLEMALTDNNNNATTPGATNKQDTEKDAQAIANYFKED